MCVSRVRVCMCSVFFHVRVCLSVRVHMCVCVHVCVCVCLSVYVHKKLVIDTYERPIKSKRTQKCLSEGKNLDSMAVP